MAAPTLAEVLDMLHEIAPLELAVDWDNVGLLLQPWARPRRIARIVLTIDLTEPVIAEARAARADLVVAYHPPLFQPLRRLDRAEPAQRRVLAALAADFAVYSPHTALDAAPSGLADWLIDGLLAGLLPDGAAPKDLRPCGDGEFGRFAELPRAVPLARVLQQVRRHLGVQALQVARPIERSAARPAVRSLAVAAGAGGGVLRGTRADLWLTGELSHHDALAATAAGTTVVLAGHSNTERGFLKVLQKRLRAEFAAVDVRLSRRDRDPFAAG